MNELIFELEEITPKEFFGAQNSNIELLKKYFPKLKIVARGNKIKAFGDEELLEEFDRKLTMLLKHFADYNKLDENAIERVLSSHTSDEYKTSSASGEVIVHGVGGRLIKAETANQRRLVESIRKNDMVFAIGPAGTGKTYTGVALAVQALKNKEVKRIILTRPAVEAGENLGFLPGDLKEKLDPYMQPLYDALRDM
ncbi:MAG TPA: PhoH family protein, partial [Flavobacteriaceae bacterium]|nr:PhoH family protein [Flavobacteriaceae bacterium]